MTHRRAAQISNDISEGCCRASRQELMAAVNFFSILACTHFCRLRSAQAKVLLDALTHHEDLDTYLRAYASAPARRKNERTVKAPRPR